MSASFVIVRKETGEAILEVFGTKSLIHFNYEKVKAVPILEYLQGLNRQNKC